MGNTNECLNPDPNSIMEFTQSKTPASSFLYKDDLYSGTTQDVMSTYRRIIRYGNYPNPKSNKEDQLQTFSVLQRKIDRLVSNPRLNKKRSQNKIFCYLDPNIVKRYKEINIPAIKSKRVTLYLRKAIYSQYKLLIALRNRYFSIEAMINELEGADYRSAMSEYDTKKVEPFQPGVGFKYFVKISDRLKIFDQVVRKKLKLSTKSVDSTLKFGIDKNAIISLFWNLNHKKPAPKKLILEKSESVKLQNHPKAFILTNLCRNLYLDSTELVSINPNLDLAMFDLAFFPRLQNLNIRLDHEKFDISDLNYLFDRISKLENLRNMILDLGFSQSTTKQLNAHENIILNSIFTLMINNKWRENIYGLYNHMNRCLVLSYSSIDYNKFESKAIETINITKFSSVRSNLSHKKTLLIDLHFDIILRFGDLFGNFMNDIDNIRFKQGDQTFYIQNATDMIIETPGSIYFDQPKIKNMKKFCSLFSTKIKSFDINLHPSNTVNDEFIHEIFGSAFKSIQSKGDSAVKSKGNHSSGSKQSKQTVEYYQLESFKACFALNQVISQAGAEIISFYLSKLPFLKVIDLNLYNCLQLKDRGCVQLASTISDISFLKSLKFNIGGIFNLNVDAISKILKSFQKLQLIEEIDLCFDFCLMFGYNHILDVCEILKMTNTLKKVAFSFIGCDLLDYESYFRLFERISTKDKLDKIMVKFGNFTQTMNENQFEKLIIDRFIKSKTTGAKEIKLYIFESFSSKFPNLEKNIREAESKKLSKTSKLELRVEKASKYVEKNYFFENFVNNLILNSPSQYFSYIADFKMCLVENLSLQNFSFNPKALAYALRSQTPISDVKLLASLNYVTNFHTLVESLRTLQPENLKIIVDFTKRVQESFDETNPQDKQLYNFQEKSTLKTLKLNFKEALNITDQTLQEVLCAKSRLIYITRIKIEFRNASITDKTLIDLSFLMSNLLKLNVIQLDLSYCRKITEKGLNYFATTLSRLSNIDEIHLNLSDCNSIKAQGFDDLNNAMGKLVTLKKLIVSYMGCWAFNDSKFVGMANSIYRLKMLSLLHLNLSYCKIEVSTLKNFLMNVRNKTNSSGVAILTENGLLEHDKI